MVLLKVEVSKTANIIYNSCTIAASFTWFLVGLRVVYGIFGLSNVPGTFALMKDSSLSHHATQTVP